MYGESIFNKDKFNFPLLHRTDHQQFYELFFTHHLIEAEKIYIGRRRTRRSLKKTKKKIFVYEMENKVPISKS